MEEQPNVPANNTNTGAAPTGTAALQPDPSLQPPTINVSPAARAANFSPADPIPPPQPADKEWTPSRQSTFTDSPRSIILFSLFGVIVTVLFLTVGISVNVWVKFVVLLLLSVGGLINAMRAYETDNDTFILLGIIISTIIFIGTGVVGSTYVYYTYKIKEATSSLQTLQKSY